MMIDKLLKTGFYDPYDIWSSPWLGPIKVAATQGQPLPVFLAASVSLGELIAPIGIRKLLGIPRHTFPYSTAIFFLSAPSLAPSHGQDILKYFQRSAIPAPDCYGWGLPFPWYSKNGTYGADTPYITNTPYVMEILLRLQEHEEHREAAAALFHRTWHFLQVLRSMEEDDSVLALSYSPKPEPRIVVNANSYAALAYAMHAHYGIKEHREIAYERLTKIVEWVIRSQASNGSWSYYADRDPGNFIDCFHSCLIVRNLLQIAKLFPELEDRIAHSTRRGWAYIKDTFYDSKHRLCKRYSHMRIASPFRWELYDQAEFLGLLIEFGELERAVALRARVLSTFRRGETWYCRIDLFGRQWGRGFLRWGILPFLLASAKLDQALRKEGAALCAE